MWKTKLVLLLIVYFSGFATAVYYLAPPGSRQCQAAEYSGNSASRAQDIDSQAVTGYCSKVYAKASDSFSKVDWKAVKEKVNNMIRELVAKAKSCKNKPVKDAE